MVIFLSIQWRNDIWEKKEAFLLVCFERQDIALGPSSLYWSQNFPEIMYDAKLQDKFQTLNIFNNENRVESLQNNKKLKILQKRNIFCFVFLA